MGVQEWTVTEVSLTNVSEVQQVLMTLGIYSVEM